MSRIKLFTAFSLAVAIAATLFFACRQPAAAQGGSGNINIAINPYNPGWGQNFAVSTNAQYANGRPVSYGSIVFWFSGQHHIGEDHRWTIYLDKNGSRNFLAQIPWYFKYYTSWVNLNAWCPQTGKISYWRIKG